MNTKPKFRIKIRQTNLDILSNQILLESVDHLLAHSSKGANLKRCAANIFYLPKAIIKSCNFIINGKNFYDQAIDSDIKRYKEIRNYQQDKAKITLLDVYEIMIISKIIID